MNIILQPPGGRGDHLGLSHALKHYLNPSEAWDDIADDVPEDLRPRAVWKHAEGPPDPAAHYDLLLRTYQRGYGALVKQVASPLAEPPEAPPWCRHPKGNGRWASHAGNGVVLVARRRRDNWHMHTAYRASRFKFTDYARLPAHDSIVELRRKMASCFAEKIVARWRREEAP